MADPVIVPPGQTFERACIQACAALAFYPPVVAAEVLPSSPPLVLIPNVALRSAILNWCDRLMLPHPSPLPLDTAGHIVRRLMPPPPPRQEQRPPPPANSVRTRNRYSYGGDEFLQEPNQTTGRGSLEEEIMAVLAAEGASPSELKAAMASLRQATRENREMRIQLCTPRLLAALRPMLLSGDAGVQVNAAASMVNLSLEAENKARIVRSGAVSPLVDVLRSGHPEARDHAAGAMYSLAVEDENRAAIGVLGAVPPLLDLLTSTTQHPRARRDAGMALYYLSLAAVNQSKVARFPGAPKALLAAASDAAEPTPIRRLALMVICNVGACAEGRATLMDAGAVAAVAGILSDDTTRVAELEEWCVAAIYALSRGSLRFRGLAHAAGADKALRRVADEGAPGGVRREMARKTLRAMRTDLDNDADADLTGSSLECGDGDDCGGSIVSDGLMSFRRRQRDLGASSCGNTTEF